MLFTVPEFAPISLSFIIINWNDQSFHSQSWMNGIASNIKRVKGKIAQAAIKAERNPDEIKLLAVSKTVEPERIKEAYDAGLTLFGENRIQEAQKKKAELPATIHWHLVGHLQSNKVKNIFELFELIHSIDSLPLAEEIQKRAMSIGKTINVLVQVNTSGEKTKFGVPFAQAISVAKEIIQFENLNVMGLMTIPPYSDSPENSRIFYKKLKSVKMKLASENLSLPELSMGMSNDYEVAIEEGATIIRVGTAIFGSRS